jgi:hypothetical protein
VRALALRHYPRRPLGVLLVAALLSVAGDGVTQVGVPWFVLLTTGSAGKAVFPLYRQMSEPTRQPVP